MPNLRIVAAIAATGALVAACYKVPYTGRKALNPVPDKLMVMLSAGQYKEMLAAATVERKGDDAKLLDQIGVRIAKVAKQPDYDWEVALIREDTINAWCMPGGKIGFYTGILPVLENEAGVAFVMGHEVGHAVARHGGERLGQQLALFGGLAGLYAVLDQKTKLDVAQKSALVGAIGAGAELGIILPFSRAHESEADVIGTMYMASAGYPPAEAITVWDRMGAGSKGPSMPAFLSTHPSDEHRQKVIKEWLPQARKRYERNKIDRDTTKQIWGGKQRQEDPGSGTGVGAPR